MYTLREKAIILKDRVDSMTKYLKTDSDIYMRFGIPQCINTSDLNTAVTEIHSLITEMQTDLKEMMDKQNEQF